MPTRSAALLLKIAAVAAVLATTPGAAQVTAPGTDWPKIVAAARKEGQVMLYSLQSPGSVDRVVSGFRKAYPEIAVQYLRTTTGRMSGRLDRERAAANGDGADVWINSEPAWLKERSKEGQLLKLVGPAAGAWPAQGMSASGDFVMGGLELQAFAYNKQLLERPPRSFAELVRPEYVGMIGAPDPFGGTVAAWYDWLEKSLGPDYLLQLKAQKPKFYNNQTAMMEALASGEIALAAFSSASQVKPLVVQGAPLEFVIPEPTAGVPLYVAAMGWSKKPNAAQVLADFFLSREGQVAWHGTGDSASPLPGIPGAVEQGNAAVLDASAYSRAALGANRERWNKLFR